MCFPRIQAFDRLRGRAETFANCGAVAGTLARLDEQRSPWQRATTTNCCCASRPRPQLVLTEAERARLAAHGLNPLQSLRSASPRALAAEDAGGRQRRRLRPGALLTAQRRSLLLMASIERGTRWAVFERRERPVWRRLERQVQSFLQPLADDRAVRARRRSRARSRWSATSASTAPRTSRPAASTCWCRCVLRGPARARSFMVTHARSGSRVRPVTRRSSCRPKRA